ncbi:hypothetical protein A3C96_02925 [Candidatus Uhrbacteria bacterium RIFCSPHIGHO2_02_FULL_60_10]|uniref:Glycerophosphoryl diester phosphodiesterase membrane domain-containing protein n=1 Tax=Candidatus Uhrbacteria bacterium RIFCSPHIGHO2_02_FULL_60_10 TaxID=1802392 RepID=A0A1F7U638_9BACT|nr:MAG: hypothetical protein A3C96_02925 [Candidatus Uhrbacteria bacterium RIFCSPHIGHO2_02_FULL_60_10]
MDRTPFFRRLIGDAVRVTFTRTHLWLFGVFAALAGFGGLYEAFYRSFGMMFGRLTGAVPAHGVPYVRPMWLMTKTVFKASEWPLFKGLLFVIVCGAVLSGLVWLTSIAVGALIGSVRRIVLGGTAHFSDGWRIGTQRFPTVLAILLTTKAALLFITLLAGANLIGTLRDGTWWAIVLYAVSFLVYMAIMAGAVLLSVLAANYAVIRGERFAVSVSHAAKLLTDNWLICLEALFVLFVLDLLVGMLSLIALTVLAFPAMALLSWASSASAPVSFIAMKVLFAFAIVVMVVVVGAMYATLRTVFWTLLWMELSENSRAARLLRWFGKRLAWKRR